MQLQTPAVFTLANMAGDYVVTLNGRNGSNPTSVLGRITLGAGGASTNVSFDRSVAGVGTAGPTTTATLAFVGAPDTNGRATFTFMLNDGLPVATSQTFAYYAVTANRIAAVETDANGIMTADFSKQQNFPFSASTVITTGSVFGLAGMDLTLATKLQPWVSWHDSAVERTREHSLGLQRCGNHSSGPLIPLRIRPSPLIQRPAAAL